MQGSGLTVAEFERGDSSPVGNAAVTLDLWLTLIAEHDGTQRSLKRYEVRAEYTGKVLAKHGFIVDRNALLDASRTISGLVTADHDLGIDLEFSHRIRQLLSLVDPDLPDHLSEAALSEIADAVDQAFLDSPPIFLPGAHDVLAQLDGMNVRVALISNTGLTSAPAYREWFLREGVLDYFDHLTFSNEVACAKPSPDIFHPTLSQLAVAPENSLHIGDNLLTDISGAAGVGMKTGWIAGHDDREPIVKPDFTLSGVNDIPAVVERWLESRSAGD
jgi:HAD superfamily hydrolase (TIGR01549 family)